MARGARCADRMTLGVKHLPPTQPMTSMLLPVRCCAGPLRLVRNESLECVDSTEINVRNGGQGTGVLPSPMAARQSTINNIIVSDEAILSAENGGKPLGGRGSAPNPAGRAHSAPRPLAGGEGACCSSQGTPLPAVSLRTWPPIKNPGQALGTA